MKSVIYVCFFTLLLSSCSTSDNQYPLELESNFYALTVGNEWVYKNYKYNLTTQAYDDTGVIDSVSIVGTEVVNTYTYFKFRNYTTGNEEDITFCNTNGQQFELLRESIGYFIRDDGSVMYANNNFERGFVSSADWGLVYEELICALEVIPI